MKLRPLADLVEIDRRSVQPDKIEVGTPYLGLDSIASGGKILRADTVGPGDLSSQKFLFDERHVLFGKLRPNLAKVARPGFSGICSTDILPLKPLAEIDRDYLAHFLLTREAVAWATSRTSGANLPRLSPSVLGTMQVPLPPLPEQRRIASILDQATSIASAAELRQSHLRRLVEAQFHRCIASAALVKHRLGEIAEVVGGSTPKSGVASYWDGDIPWITPADLSRRSEVVVNSTSRTISDEGLKSIGGRLLPVRSVLLSSRAPIGLVGLVGVPMATNQGFKSLVVNQALVDETFLYWWLKLNRVLLESRGVGATFKELSKSIVESIPVELPLLGIQKKFAREAESIEKLRLQAVSVSARANELLRSLKSRTFRGEL